MRKLFVQDKKPKKLKQNNLIYNVSQIMDKYPALQPQNINRITTVDGNPVNVWFSDKINEPILSLPDTIKTMRFQYSFNQHIRDIKFPQKCEFVELGTYDDSFDDFPDYVSFLILRNILHSQSLYNLSCLTTVDIFLRNNLCSLFDKLPPNLKKLSLGGDFNQPLVNLPSKLVTLRLMDIFNHPVTNLPTTLTELHIDNKDFNNSIDLPPCLHKFTLISETYTKPISCLPTSLTEIICNYVGNIRHEILRLTNLTKLIILENNEKENEEVLELPKNLQFLQIKYLQKVVLHENLNTILTGFGDNNVLQWYIGNKLYGIKLLQNEEGNKCCFEGIKYLHIEKTEYDINQLLKYICCGTITELYLTYLQQEIIDNLPSSITRLNLHPCFPTPININNLHPNLTYLNLCNIYNFSLEMLPESIEYLFINRSINPNDIPQIENLPKNLKCLVLSCSFMEIEKLPPKLTTLVFSSHVRKLHSQCETIEPIYDCNNYTDYQINYDTKVIEKYISHVKCLIISNLVEPYIKTSIHKHEIDDCNQSISFDDLNKVVQNAENAKKCSVIYWNCY